MITPIIRFSSRRNFKIEVNPSQKTFFLLFLDENNMRKFFCLPENLSMPSCVSLPLPKNYPWGKKGDMISALCLSGLQRQKIDSLLATYPEYPREQGYFFLTPSLKKNYDEEIESDHFSCCYTLHNNNWYPVSYTPFQNTRIELELPQEYDFVVFGSESDLSVAVVEEEGVVLSPLFGALTDWSQLEMAHQWMERHTKQFNTKGRVFHEYYHDSLLHTYLSRYSQKNAYTHTEAHFANVLFDNRFLKTPLLGIIFDREDHTSSGTIEGSDIVYGTMAKCTILGSWRPIPIPGNASTHFEPWRITLAVLREVYGDLNELFIPFMEKIKQNQEIRYIIDAINKRIINVTPSSSMTHIIIALFELLDYHSLIEEYDMINKRIDELFITNKNIPLYEVSLISEENHTYLDTYDIIRQVIDSLQRGEQPQEILQRALHSLFAHTASLVKDFSETYHEKRVALSGELFTHPHLLALMEHYLKQAGLSPVIHQRIPTGDSSVALGALLHILAQKEAKSLQR